MDGKTILSSRTEDEIIADLTRSRQGARRVRPAENDLHSHHNDDTTQEQSVVPQPERDNDTVDTNTTVFQDDERSQDEDEDEAVVEPKEREPSHLARRQNAKFDSFIENHLMRKQARSAALSEKDEEQKPIKWLMKNIEGKNIISSPRDYQIELFERAKTDNIIAVLDTGSGKTLIAVLLLRHIMEQEMEDRAVGKNKRISFFLVDSVALVFQQYAVLDANLDQPKEQFCGNMISDHDSKIVWEKAFSENMVIVCTADLLNHCLHRSFIRMNQINLLIFDEAHHAKKNHVYARIIKDFYIHEDKALRPKIFGMTASPVDSKVDARQASLELETLLHCRIVTASDPSVFQHMTRTKQESIASYEPLQLPFKTSLYLMVETLFKDILVLRKPMEFARHASSELGCWCADRVWLACMREEEVKELVAKTERKFHAGKIPSLEECEAQVSRIHIARKAIHDHVFAAPQPTLDCLSTKVKCLMDYLQERFKRQTDDKAIVFVDRRYTAKVLAELFDHPDIGTPHLRVGSLVGIRQGSVGDSKTSLRQQVLILRNFRQGKLNCLFATSVAEEGLDIPDCNLVIRFDLYRTVTQFIQSRGRARHMNSSYVHFREVGNRAHTALIREVKANENILRQFCQSLPEDRLLTGNDCDMEYFLAKEKTHRVYTEPETGAKLTYRSSLEVLANFVSSLALSSEGSLHPEYVVTPQLPRKFICEVILPQTSPIRGAIGRPHSTKQVAKCSAAFETCLLLKSGKHLDKYLQSTYRKQLPAMRNAHLAVSSKKRSGYRMRTKPSLWTVDTIPTSLYLTVFALVDPSAAERPTQPLGILTRSSLPKLPEFPLHFGRGLKSDLRLHTYANPLDVNGMSLATIDTFTLRIFKDVFSKKYQSNVARMPYFLVPIKNGYKNLESSEMIAWDIMEFVAENETLSWDENTPDEFFKDKFMADNWIGARKLWSIRVSREYKPLDPVPPNVAPLKFRNGAARRAVRNITEYSFGQWGKNRANRVFREDQPVIQAEYIPLRRNYLDDSEQLVSQDPTRCFVIPEPMNISALPTPVVAMAYLFPAVIHRVESYLIALEACGMLHLSIPADLALEALTKDSDNTEEHNEEQIHVQRGMGKNYERLEFLGDSFLKMATSIAIYTLHPGDDEYQYHVKRMLLLCNKNLFNNALELGLEEYIRSKALDRRVWYPEGLTLLSGKGAGKPNDSNKHELGDKTIADVCEALIGAALLTQHETGNMDSAVRAVTEFVSSDDHRMTAFADYHKAYKMPQYQVERSTEMQKSLCRQVLKEHPYHFKYPRLLRSAFVHPSYPYLYEKVPNYQRLEFLGDSLLDMVCINFLFYRYPDRNPQWLTEHKMAMVSNQFLGAVCVDLRFYKHILTFSTTVQSQITDYVTAISDARAQAEDDAEAEGKSRSEYARDFWVNTAMPPKCLPDIVEAFIGAVFIDSGYNFAEVERFFDLHIKHYFEDMRIYDTFANKHPVTFLHNLMGQYGCNQWRTPCKLLPDYGDGVSRISVAVVMIHGNVIAHKEAKSGRYAKIGATELALGMLTGLGRPAYRAKYGCDCEVDENGEDKLLIEEVDHSTAI